MIKNNGKGVAFVFSFFVPLQGFYIKGFGKV